MPALIQSPAESLMSRLALLLATMVVLFSGAAHAQQPPDAYYGLQWNLQRIGVERAWDHATGEGAVIAVVDSGIDLTHPELEAKTVFTGDADFIDDRPPCQSSEDDGCDPDGPQDEFGHGTHVAGIAAATTGNLEGIAGVARAASVLPVRVLDAQGNGTTTQIAAGVRFAADQGAEVINLSLAYDSIEGLVGELDPLYSAIDDAWESGAVIVASAGNDSFPLCAEPAAHPRVVCVGAIDRSDLRSFYSNSDATMTAPFVVAPGGNGLSDAGICSGDILSTYLLDLEPFCGPEMGYEAVGGTSQAAPHVAGVAAMLAELGLANDAIVECLVTTAEDLGAVGRDPVYGFGLVDAARAVTECPSG
ncbi:MAG TPA: S8 family serine peptidase [Actinomycetota bacterium]|nr:S8 family serine peptidase [Actinomycetota bacterium]